MANDPKDQREKGPERIIPSRPTREREDSGFRDLNERVIHDRPSNIRSDRDDLPDPQPIVINKNKTDKD